MTDITIGTTVRSVKNGTTATVASIDKKYKTALIEFDDGTARSYSLSTLKDKRQWVIVTNDDTIESAQKHDSEALEAVSEETTKQEASKYVEASAAITKELNKNNSKSLKEMVDAQIDEDVAGDGTPLAEVGREIAEQAKKKAKKVYDDDLMSKFVKKAQKIITSATHDQSGYHVTIVYDNKTKSFDDKNLQNIRSAIGHIYRGEVAI